MKRYAKQLVLRTARSAGAFGMLAGSNWRKQRLLILAYHGVSLLDEHEWNPYLFITPQQLEERLNVLRRGGYSIISLGEALQRLEKGTLSGRSVALTFDDGFHNFYAAAMPVLLRHQAPATVYLTTYYVEHQRSVPYISASYLLWKHRHTEARITAIPGFDAPVRLASETTRRSVHQAIIKHCEDYRLSAVDKDSVLRHLASDLGANYEQFNECDRLMRLMTEESVNKASRTEMLQFELHTHRHRVPLDEQLFRKEIHDNRTAIHQMTGHLANHFCYPSGVWDERFFPWLKKDNVRSATTCMHGLSSNGSNLMLLPRFVDHSQTSMVEFEAWLCGLGEHIPSQYKYAPAGS
jgi:peptidoglycan/xylan/chitin deacetylase (PgdA/CDA1 family)